MEYWTFRVLMYKELKLKKRGHNSYLSVPQESNSCSRMRPRGSGIVCWCKSSPGPKEGIPTLGRLVRHMLSIPKKKYLSTKSLNLINLFWSDFRSRRKNG